MLVITRRAGEKIHIGDDITIWWVKVKGVKQFKLPSKHRRTSGFYGVRLKGGRGRMKLEKGDIVYHPERGLGAVTIVRYWEPTDPEPCQVTFKQGSYWVSYKGEFFPGSQHRKDVTKLPWQWLWRLVWRLR